MDWGVLAWRRLPMSHHTCQPITCRTRPPPALCGLSHRLRGAIVHVGDAGLELLVDDVFLVGLDPRVSLLV